MYSYAAYQKQVSNISKGLSAIGLKKWQADMIIDRAKTTAAQAANGRMNFLFPAQVANAAVACGFAV
jgi:hypothetical protein